MTAMPRARRLSVRCEPMKPAAPVTSALSVGVWSDIQFLQRGFDGWARRHLAAADLGEQARVALGTALDRETRFAALAAGGAVGAPQRRVVRIGDHRLGECV